MNDVLVNSSDTPPDNDSLDDTLDSLQDSLAGDYDVTAMGVSPQSSHASPTGVRVRKRRANTNSEYMPLPPVLAKKKKKTLKNDMGYSQPRKKRKKKLANRFVGRASAADETLTTPVPSPQPPPPPLR